MLPRGNSESSPYRTKHGTRRSSASGTSKKTQARALRTQQITISLLIGGGLACLVSILLLMRSLDSEAPLSTSEILDEPEIDSDGDSLSIRALHMLHQAKVRANQASQLESLQEKLAQPCIDYTFGAVRSASYLLPADTGILIQRPRSIPPPPSPFSNSQQQSVQGLEQATSSKIPPPQQTGNYQADPRTGPEEFWNAPGNGVCYRWFTDLSLRFKETGTDSRLALVEFKVSLPGGTLSDELEEDPFLVAEMMSAAGGSEAKKEAWQGEASVRAVLLGKQRMSMSMSFWGAPSGFSQIWGAGTRTGDQNTQKEFLSTGAVLEELGRVESLPVTYSEQRILGPIMALVPDGASVFSTELCVSEASTTVLRNMSVPYSVGLMLTLKRSPNRMDPPEGDGNYTTEHTEKEFQDVQEQCNLLQSPSLRYLSYVPATWQQKEAVWGNVSSAINFGIGQLAVTWESNCNAVVQRVLLCRRHWEAGKKAEKHECGFLDPVCGAHSAAGNQSQERNSEDLRNVGHHITFSYTDTVQVTKGHWVHTVRLPPLLPSGHYQYRVKTGTRCSAVHSFHNVASSWLTHRRAAAELERGGTWKGPEGSVRRRQYLKTRAEMLRKRVGVKDSKRSARGATKVGTKGVFGRKGHERGPTGVSFGGGIDDEMEDDDEFLHVALVSDTESGSAVFSKHLQHMRAHRPSPDLWAHVGDRVQNSSSIKEWLSLWSNPVRFSQLSSSAPEIGVHGNHNLDERGLAKAFAPLPSRKGWYATVIGDCLWIGLDSNVDPKIDKTQTQFLHSTLASFSDARAQRRAPPFAVVLVHIPPFVDYWDSKAWHSGEKHSGEWVREEWVPLFEKYKVDLVVSGHSHTYQRGERNGVTYAIIGGGGDKLDKQRVEDWGMYKVTYRGFHYVAIDISAHLLSWTAYDQSNNPVDHVLFAPDIDY